MTGVLFPHRRNDRLGYIDDAEQVCVNLRAEVVDAGVFDRTEISVPGDIRDHVQSAERRDRGFDCVAGGGEVGHVERDDHRAVAKRCGQRLQPAHVASRGD